ncbi:MAG: hypothetical protein H7326_07670 [Bdellovibrionaceae bacterium]|nr:hypothetical protein [Pseudobdellovibrionaceae bacterium]
MKILSWAIGICLLCTVPAFSATRSFRVYSLKQVTSQVDRLYGADRNAFATLFCRDDAAEVMFVDGRIPELDGVNFFFESPKACFEARALIRSSYRNCTTELSLNTRSLAAQVKASHCQ